MSWPESHDSEIRIHAIPDSILQACSRRPHLVERDRARHQKAETRACQSRYPESSLLPASFAKQPRFVVGSWQLR
ncbi:hypothetical protein BDW69DRAFT_120149 [Aspergillus filifer]